ncbi:RipA family octameric membrane protein [Shewanella donghaensis]|uniref:RipA family octameric membrane protein n=1 Tax=Shewanella donghaensis TaxID=238836 RepID=UPI0018787858|nr:hypothetical protein [Shewanella donghaensis]
MNTEKVSKILKSQDAKTYNLVEHYNNHLLEQYKIYLSSAENISNRRQSSNTFFVTLNTTLISLITYINLGATENQNYYWAVSLIGIIISFMWYRIIRSYKDINTAKFKVINEIEKELPISPYKAEWELLGRGNDSKVYLPFTKIEAYIPWAFSLLHFIVLTGSILPIIYSWLC